MGSRDSIPWTNYIGIGYVACQRLNMLGAARLFCMESMRRSEELKEMRESANFPILSLSNIEAYIYETVGENYDLATTIYPANTHF
jgi:hypothetical protein